MGLIGFNRQHPVLEHHFGVVFLGNASKTAVQTVQSGIALGAEFGFGKIHFGIIGWRRLGRRILSAAPPLLKGRYYLDAGGLVVVVVVAGFGAGAPAFLAAGSTAAAAFAAAGSVTDSATYIFILVSICASMATFSPTLTSVILAALV